MILLINLGIKQADCCRKGLTLLWSSHQLLGQDRAEEVRGGGGRGTFEDGRAHDHWINFSQLASCRYMAMERISGRRFACHARGEWLLSSKLLRYPWSLSIEVQNDRERHFVNAENKYNYRSKLLYGSLTKRARFAIFKTGKQTDNSVITG